MTVIEASGRSRRTELERHAPRRDMKIMGVERCVTRNLPRLCRASSLSSGLEKGGNVKMLRISDIFITVQ